MSNARLVAKLLDWFDGTPGEWPLEANARKSPRAPTVDELREALQGCGPWLVVICREGDCEVTPFEDETEATEFFDRASTHWSDSYLCRAVRWPKDVHARTGAGTATREGGVDG